MVAYTTILSRGLQDQGNPRVKLPKTRGVSVISVNFSGSDAYLVLMMRSGAVHEYLDPIEAHIGLSEIQRRFRGY
jgi:hypothetical protein